jgi:hypothetical protein
MTSEANKYQVDGQHYKTAYEHWDYSLDAGLGVLEYAATKHLGRFHKKGEPIKDLQKAQHYVRKLMENLTVVSLLCPRDRFNQEYLSEVAGKFIDANNIPYGIAQAVELLTLWTTHSQLEEALEFVTEELEDRMGEEETAPKEPGPVPLEDSNKHALHKDPD